MKRLQLASAMIIMAFAALICFEASKLSLGTSRNPGPGLLPLAVGALLFVLALIFALKTIFQGTMTGSAGALWSGLKWRRVFYTLAGLFGYALFLNRLGYLICTWIFMTYLFWGEGAKRRYLAIIGSLAVSVVTYFIFRSLLKVRLPLGLIRF